MQNYNILVFLGSEYIINTTFLDFGNITKLFGHISGSLLINNY